MATEQSQARHRRRSVFAVLSDTSPEAERVQIELLRKLTPAQRVSTMRSLTATALRLSRRALARANPGLQDREIDLLFIELNYGKPLADEIRRHRGLTSHDAP